MVMLIFTIACMPGLCIELLLLLCVLRIMTADEFISTTEQVFRKYFYGFSAANILAECLVF